MKRIQHLTQLVKPYYSQIDPAHDWAHVERVAKTAKKIAKDSDVGLECILAGVYCHDLINLPKDHPERKNASTLTAIEAEPILIKAGFVADEIQIIKKIIVEHSFSKGLTPSCLEAGIVQDADRLDALGAIGILRCAAVNAQMKTAFYDPLDPFAEKRELDDKAFMLDHYFVKLFKLPELMNTSQGKILALKKVEFMKTFVQNLKSEIE